MNYYYGMRLRGCSLGAQPQGFTRRLDAKGNMSDYYDILEYPFELAIEDIKHYSLDYLGCGETLENAQAQALGSYLGKKLNLRRL